MVFVKKSNCVCPFPSYEFVFQKEWCAVYQPKTKQPIQPVPVEQLLKDAR